MKLQPKAVLLDSGRTLNFPQTGHWFIPPNFVAFFRNDLEKAYSKVSMKAAFAKANTYWDTHQRIETEQQEYDHFKNFYAIFFRSLDYPHVTDGLLSDLAQDVVFNDEKYTFFDDVQTILPELAQRFRLGLVSDAWPSLERVFINQRLRDYFSTFVISSKIGVSKPNPKMFSAALEDLQLSPAETVFVDDNLRNLEGAYALGIQPIFIDRDNRISGRLLKLYGIMRFLTHAHWGMKMDLKAAGSKSWPFPRIGNLSDLANLLAVE